MPPRFAYWTIIVDNQPTAFRAKDRRRAAADVQPPEAEAPVSRDDVVPGRTAVALAAWRRRMPPSRRDARKTARSARPSSRRAIANGGRAARTAIRSRSTRTRGRRNGRASRNGCVRAPRPKPPGKTRIPAAAAPAQGGRGVIAHVVLFTPRASLSPDERRTWSPISSAPARTFPRFAGRVSAAAGSSATPTTPSARCTSSSWPCSSSTSEADLRCVPASPRARGAGPLVSSRRRGGARRGLRDGGGRRAERRSWPRTRFAELRTQRARRHSPDGRETVLTDRITGDCLPLLVETLEPGERRANRRSSA